MICFLIISQSFLYDIKLKVYTFINYKRNMNLTFSDGNYNDLNKKYNPE